GPVGKSLARQLPGLPEVRASPDPGPVPLAGSRRVDVAGDRVVDRLVYGPALAVRSAHLPVAAVAVALQDEAALAGADQQQDAGHGHLQAGACCIPTDVSMGGP